VRASSTDQRDWLRKAPVCTLLAQHHVAHTGLLTSHNPFKISRPDQSGTFFMACFEGEGEVLVDGRWKPVCAGEACLLPPFVANAVQARHNHSWKFCWVRYLESREGTPILSALSPVSGRLDPNPIRHAITGLHAEACGSHGTAALYHWIELIHQYVLSFAQPHRHDQRLWRLWRAVESAPGRAWSLPELASLACVSEEHLRRLCHRELGRSPMQHLTFLRMQRARQLLATTDAKVETIARNLGYENPFSFSNTFKKWIGWRPSELRSPRNSV
jgi:AraC-like DNA-binding protein